MLRGVSRALDLTILSLREAQIDVARIELACQQIREGSRRWTVDREHIDGHYVKGACVSAVAIGPRSSEMATHVSRIE